jgi:hypothetical protein
MTPPTTMKRPEGGRGLTACPGKVALLGPPSCRAEKALAAKLSHMAAQQHTEQTLSPSLRARACAHDPIPVTMDRRLRERRLHQASRTQFRPTVIIKKQGTTAMMLATPPHPRRRRARSHHARITQALPPTRLPSATHPLIHRHSLKHSIHPSAMDEME